MRARAAPNTVSGWHHHGDRQVLGHVVRGRARFELFGGRESTEVEQGGFFHVPAGLFTGTSTPLDELQEIILLRCCSSSSTSTAPLSTDDAGADGRGCCRRRAETARQVFRGTLRICPCCRPSTPSVQMPSLPRIRTRRAGPPPHAVDVAPRPRLAELQSDGLTWIHLEAPSHEEAQLLAARFGWHPARRRGRALAA